MWLINRKVFKMKKNHEPWCLRNQGACTLASHDLTVLLLKVGSAKLFYVKFKNNILFI